jgi:hypothetical protein
LSPHLHREYLLGGLGKAEREEIEEEYFLSDDSFDAMLDAERDLLDAYVRGQLSAGDRLRVEEHLLVQDSQRRKLAVAVALAAGLSKRRFPFLRLLPYAAIIVLAAGLGIEVAKNRSLEQRLSARAVQPAQSMPGSFVIEFAANAVRGAAGKRIVVIPAGAEFVQLRFESNEGGAKLAAEVKSSGGASVWKQAGLSPQSGIVAMWLPAAVLHAGDFELHVSDAGGNATGYFEFRIQ